MIRISTGEVLLVEAGVDGGLSRQKCYIDVEVVLAESASGRLEVLLAGGFHVLEDEFVLVGSEFGLHLGGGKVSRWLIRRVGVRKNN